jgi:hypothetical protein
VGLFSSAGIMSLSDSSWKNQPSLSLMCSSNFGSRSGFYGDGHAFDEEQALIVHAYRSHDFACTPIGYYGNLL